MKGVIRLGDPTSHGGSVTTASSKVTVRGKRVAVLGDQLSCPIPGHHDCYIKTVKNPNIKHNGIPVATEGDVGSCGCVLMSTAPKSGKG